MQVHPRVGLPRMAACKPVTDAVIVIFGAAVRPGGRPSATLRHRVDAAARFAAELSSPLLIPTGGVGRFGPSEASVMRDQLTASGIAADRIVPEETGTDTLSSVRAVARLLTSRAHHGPVFVATSAYHLPRCVLLLRLAGLPARGCPISAAAASNRLLPRWYWRLRELPAIPYDTVLLITLRLFGRL